MNRTMKMLAMCGQSNLRENNGRLQGMIPLNRSIQPLRTINPVSEQESVRKKTRWFCNRALSPVKDLNQDEEVTTSASCVKSHITPKILPYESQDSELKCDSTSPDSSIEHGTKDVVEDYYAMDSDPEVISPTASYNSDQDPDFNLDSDEETSSSEDSHISSGALLEVHEDEFMQEPTIEVGEVSPDLDENPRKVYSRDFCYYCESLVLNFARHIIRNHSCEVEVQHILSKPVKSRERKNLLTSLRKKGNYLKSGDGCFKPMKKSQLPIDTNRSHSLCHYCLGFYAPKQLWRHKRNCTENKACNKSSPIYIGGSYKFSKIDPYLREIVFPTMRPDQISLIAQRDELICAYGARYVKIHREKHFINVTSRKMRELSRLLIELRKLQPEVHTLLDALKPENYDLLVEATKIVAKCNGPEGSFGSPTYAMNISTSLKQCCDVALTFALKKKEMHSSVAAAEAEANLKTLTQLITANWRYDVSNVAANTLNVRKWNKVTIVPLASDLKLLKEFLTNKANDAALKLSDNETNKRAFQELVETIFCRLLLLNRRRPGELQRLLLETYRLSEKYVSNSYEEFADVVSPAEKILMQRFKRIVIRGKRDRGVPVLICPDVQHHIKLAIRLRPNFIKNGNRYLFAKPDSLNSLSGYKVISKYARLCGAKQPHALTSTRLRKHLATLSQIFNMSENDIEQLATFMGHTTGIHRKSYRLPDDVYQTAKISKVLLLMESGSASEFRGKSLEEISVDLEEDLLIHDERECIGQEATENDEGQMPEGIMKKTTIKTGVGDEKKKITRIPWTADQKNLVTTFFRQHIEKKKPPKKNECEELILSNKAILHNKDWIKIKVFVQNIYSKN